MFEAKSTSSSFAWKSILKARKVIDMGARWRIGNGAQTKFFEDAWLPGSNASRVLSPVSVLSENATINQLIDSESGWWNSALIDEIFLPYEAQKIKAIPICASL